MSVTQSNYMKITLVRRLSVRNCSTERHEYPINRLDYDSRPTTDGRRNVFIWRRFCYVMKNTIMGTGAGKHSCPQGRFLLFN